GEEKVQKIAAGEEGNYRMERVPLKQTDRHHKSPGGDLCIRDSFLGGLRNKNKFNWTFIGYNTFLYTAHHPTILGFSSFFAEPLS
ncbi:hypothetical protein ACVWDS_23245, partial [Escherichia coli]